MLRTYSKLNKEWAGFRPLAYSLNKKACERSLTQLSGDRDQKKEEATTVVKLLVSLIRLDTVRRTSNLAQHSLIPLCVDFFCFIRV